MKYTSWTAALAFAWFGLSATLTAGETATTTTPTERIGIYDSRVIAYADFWSETHQKKISDLVRAAKTAKAAGDTNRFTQLDAALRKEQEQGHLQVFSTAPVDNILETLKAKLPEIQKQAGVSKLVSKWDEKTLAEHKKAEKVDVTDHLLREFKLTEKQIKMIEDMKTKPPLPLEKAKELMRKGEL